MILVFENHLVANIPNPRNFDYDHIPILQPPWRFFKGSDPTRRPSHNDSPSSKRHASAHMPDNCRDIKN